MTAIAAITPPTAVLVILTAFAVPTVATGTPGAGATAASALSAGTAMGVYVDTGNVLGD